MSTPNKNTLGKTMGIPTKGTPTNPRTHEEEEEDAVTPPRPRVMCPGCSTELMLHQTLGTNEAFMYATKVDMKKLDIECKNETCPIYIEGIGEVNKKIPANPNIIKYVEMAKKQRAAIEAAEKQANREEEEAQHANYNPFSGAREKKAFDALLEEAALKQQQKGEAALKQKQKREAALKEQLEQEGYQDGVFDQLTKAVGADLEERRRAREQ